MEFRLIYKGPLPSEGRGGGGGRNEEKHHIRVVMHDQLRALWREHPVLRDYETQDAEGGRVRWDWLADNYQKCNMRFLPLVNNKAGLACALDILFLRRDPPGSPLISGGDIDNRLKVLLDGLKMPRDCSQLPTNWKPGPTHDPMFCLMEDDNLITEIKVTTDRLLIPLAEDEHRNEVEVVVHVTTKILNPWTVSVGGFPQV